MGARGRRKDMRARDGREIAKRPLPYINVDVKKPLI